MRDKRRRTERSPGLTEAIWCAWCVDVHGRRCNPGFASHHTSKWQGTTATPCLHPSSFQPLDKGRADRSEPWTKEQASLHDLCLYSAKPVRTQYAMTSQPCVVGEAVTTYCISPAWVQSQCRRGIRFPKVTQNNFLRVTVCKVRMF